MYFPEMWHAFLQNVISRNSPGYRPLWNNIQNAFSPCFISRNTINSRHTLVTFLRILWPYVTVPLTPPVHPNWPGHLNLTLAMPTPTPNNRLVQVYQILVFWYSLFKGNDVAPHSCLFFCKHSSFSELSIQPWNHTYQLPANVTQKRKWSTSETFSYRETR